MVLTVGDLKTNPLHLFYEFKNNRHRIIVNLWFECKCTGENDSNEVGNVPGGMGKSIHGEIASDKSKVEVNKIHEIAETMPEPAFKMSRYLSSNLNYPELAMENRIQGKVMVQFVVERDGNLSAVKVIKGKELGHGLPEEAMRVVSAMPKWKPAKQSGVFVRAYFTIPVEFKLQYK